MADARARLRTIRGEAVLDCVPGPIRDATLVLRVEECSRADAAAAVVLEHRISGIARAAADRNPIRFALALPAGEHAVSAEWSVRAQLICNPLQGLARGDYVSTRRYPLAGARVGGLLRIELERLQ
jgi:hypothetical protein